MKPLPSDLSKNFEESTKVTFEYPGFLLLDIEDSQSKDKLTFLSMVAAWFERCVDFSTDLLLLIATMVPTQANFSQSSNIALHIVLWGKSNFRFKDSVT